MDRALISLKFTMLRHSTPGVRFVGWIAGAVLLAATWAAAVFASSDARHSVLALALAAWGAIAAIGPVLLSGAGVLRPSYFALLPIPRAVLGRGLLASVFVSIASGYVLLALLSAGVLAVSTDPPTLVVVLLGAPLTWVLVIATSRLIYGLLGAAMRSRIGIEIAGIQFGLMFAAMFAGWMIVQVAIQTIPGLLAHGIQDAAIRSVLDALPTSWMVTAVEAAAEGDWAGAAMRLGGLALLDLLLVLVTIRLLTPSTSAPPRSGRGRRRSAGLVAGGGVLPATQLGAIIGKELRQWRRDGWRLLEVRSGVWTGLAIGGFALASGSYAPVSAFAGLIIAFMLGLAALSVYSQDGTAIWMTIVGEDATSVRNDVRARLWAPVLVFLPQTLVISAIFVVLSGQYWTIPVLLSAIPAMFGAATGAAIIVAAVGVSPGVDPRQRVGPNDAVGNISIHVWVVIVLISIAVIPTAAAIVLLAIAPSAWTTALAIVVGLANGFGAAWALGGIATRYLAGRMPDLYSRLRYGRIFRATDGGGTLDWLERTTLKGEQQYAEQKQKQREARLARSRE